MAKEIFRQEVPSLESRVFDYLKNEVPEYLEVPCGTCPECRRRYSSDWRTRLFYELESSDNCIFVTLTFDDKCLPDLTDSRTISGMVRKLFFSYRWKYRSNYKLDHPESERAPVPRHFFITERGAKKGRLHLHGFIFDSYLFTPPTDYDRLHPVYPRGSKKPVYINRESTRRLAEIWPYGFVSVSLETTPKSITYATKYITKIHPYDTYKPRVFCSPGIGKTGILPYLGGIRRDLFAHRTPLIPSGRRMVPAPRYFRRLALSPLEALALGDDIQKDLLRSPVVFDRTFQGVRYTDQDAYFLALKRARAEYVRLGLWTPPERQFKPIADVRSVDPGRILFYVNYLKQKLDPCPF